jgi:hypothetical protein
MNTDQINKYCDKAFQNATRIKSITTELETFFTEHFPDSKCDMYLKGNLQNSPYLDIFLYFKDNYIRLSTLKKNSQFKFEYLYTKMFDKYGTDDYRKFLAVANEFYTLYHKKLTLDDAKKLCLDFGKDMELKECTLLMQQKIKEYKINKDFK